jgi:hypothetical protein
MQIERMIACPLCGEFLHYDDAHIGLQYFRGVQSSCPNCNKNIDWWTAVLRAVRMEHFSFFSLAPIGVKSIVIKIKLIPGQFFSLDFRNYGLPENAKIVELNYTPEGGGLFPAEMHGNSPLQHRGSLVRNLYPIVLADHSGAVTETNVNVLVSWVTHTADDIS